MTTAVDATTEFIRIFPVYRRIFSTADVWSDMIQKSTKARSEATIWMSDT
jgi:hypothetical protein